MSHKDRVDDLKLLDEVRGLRTFGCPGCVGRGVLLMPRPGLGPSVRQTPEGPVELPFGTLLTVTCPNCIGRGTVLGPRLIATKNDIEQARMFDLLKAYDQKRGIERREVTQTVMVPDRILMELQRQR